MFVNRENGKFSLFNKNGKPLIEGIYPHPGRKRLMVERRGGNGSRFGYWPHTIFSEINKPKIQISNQEKGIKVSVYGEYPRPDDSNQKLVGGYDIMIYENGLFDVYYCYQPLNAEGAFSEAGLSLALASNYSEFRWIGKGPYAGTPGKERLNEFGVFNLNRNDIYFQGNRQETSFAMLTSLRGDGIAIITSPTDVSVERDDENNRTFFSHNTIISSLGNKLGGGPETSVEAKKMDYIKGSFTFFPTEQIWANQLTRWFGSPSKVNNIKTPFYHSYDQ